MARRGKRRADRPTPSQARAARRGRRTRRRRVVKISAFLVVGFIAFFFIASLIAPSLPVSIGRSSSGDAGIRILDQGQAHIGSGQEHPPYNSVPATSGSHYAQPLAPVRWGVHEAFVADEYRLHNLEHGGIGVHYDCADGCPELVEQLAEIVKRSVNGGLKVILSPYPGMDTRIALTAWNFIDKLDGFDEKRIKDFINAHESSSNAPEPNAR